MSLGNSGTVGIVKVHIHRIYMFSTADWPVDGPCVMIYRGPLLVDDFGRVLYTLDVCLWSQFGAAYVPKTNPA